jgi:hypothetical protein
MQPDLSAGLLVPRLLGESRWSMMTGILETPMIQKEDTEAAIFAAYETLEQDSDFLWIKKSAILKQVYYFGLYSGLKEIADKDDVNLRICKTLVFHSVGLGSGDDTFTSTDIGKAFQSLEKQFKDYTKCGGINWNCLHDGISQIQNLLKEREQFLWDHLKAIDNLFNELWSHCQQQALIELEFHSRVFDLLHNLEHYLRGVALLETDHVWSKKLR